MLEFGNCLSASGSTVKKIFLKENKISFSERKDFVTAEDYDFFLKIAEKKGEIKQTEKDEQALEEAELELYGDVSSWAEENRKDRKNKKFLEIYIWR